MSELISEASRLVSRADVDALVLQGDFETTWRTLGVFLRQRAVARLRHRETMHALVCAAPLVRHFGATGRRDG